MKYFCFNKQLYFIVTYSIHFVQHLSIILKNKFLFTKILLFKIFAQFCS